MRWFFSFLTLAGLLMAPAAFAQLTLNWDGCSPGTPNANFVCTGPTDVARNLYGSFRVPSAMPNFQFARAYLELVDESSGILPPFWSFNSCNSGGNLSFSFDDAGACASFANPWGPSGSHGFAGSVSYSDGWYGPNTALIVIDLTLAPPGAYPLVPGQDYFMWKLRFLNTNRNVCLGCSDKIAIRWLATTLFDNQNGHVDILNSGSGSDIATGNCTGGPVYPDGDGDGYGRSVPPPDPVANGCTAAPCGGDIQVACDGVVPAGYASRAGDCNDADPSIHPGGPDSTCDGIDNNCNGSVDEGVVPGLAGWWKAEGNAGDPTGNSNGTLKNGATFGAGKVGQAFSLDGVDDYIDLSPTSHLDFGTGDFSIEGWLKLNVLNADQAVLHKTLGDYPNDYAYFLEWDAPSILRFVVRASSSNQNDLDVPVTLNAGEWHHVAAVRQGNASTLYLDGNVIGSQTAGLNVDTGSGGLARIGQLANGGRPFNGEIDELAVYNRALSASDIHSIYSAGSGGKCGLATVDVSGPAASMRPLELAPPSPNPSGRSFDLEFYLPARAVVRAEVVDVVGRLVSSLANNDAMEAGSHRLQWDGRDGAGRKVVPGVYLVRISTAVGTAAQKIIVIN